MIKRVLSFLLCVCFIVVCATTAFADELEDLRNQQAELEEQEAGYQAILDQKNAEVSDQQARVDALVGKVQTINEEIKVCHKKIDSLSKQIEEKQSSIYAMNVEIEKNMNILKQRIKTIYIAGDVSSLEIILGAKDFTDFLDKVELVKSVSDHDKGLIDYVKGQISILNTEKEDLEVDKKAQEDEEATLEEKQKELNETVDENKETLAHLQAESNEALAGLALTQDQIGNLDDEIAKLQAEAAAQQSVYMQGGGGYNTHSAPVEVDVEITEGGWVWPSPGVYLITSNFYDSEGRASAHGALDIAGPYGSTIVAARAGTVEYVCDCCTHNWGKDYYCGCGGGYGNYIQIDHGGGIEIIYAHLQSVCVSAGDTVSAGQVIGYMGSTGHSTGAHLHFETMSYGMRFDPESLF